MARVFVALDLEMTGQDYERDDIIQIGAVKFDERRVLGTWKSLVRPSVPVPLRISRLTGISNQSLRSAPRFDSVKEKLASFVGIHPIVGHSVGHDIRFLAHKGLTLYNPYYDTWELATLLMPALAAYSLESVARALHIPATDAHDAAADAEMSREVFLALLKKLSDLPETLLDEVVRLTAQTDWGLAPLFAGMGEGASTIKKGPMAGSIGAMLRSKGLSENELTSALFAPPKRTPPLEPAPEITSLDLDEVASKFEPTRELSRTFDDYEYRPQQIEMAREVSRALNEENTLMVEAGTGTGKSMAYLVPSAMWALQNGERVVISTDTINLQDQLYNKDIPDVRRALGQAGRKLKATLVKGRSNYLCLRRWEEFRRSSTFSPDELRFLVKVLLWLPNTATGDVAELPLTLEERAHWQKVCATRDSCTSKRCRFADGNQCFLLRARQEAERSHLVVVNHSLMLSDMVSDNTVLSDYKYLIVDEAHKLEAQATDQLSFSADNYAINEHLDRISHTVGADRHEGIASVLPTHLRGSRAPNEAARKVMSLSQELAMKATRARERTAEFFLSLNPVMSGVQGNANYDQHVRLTQAQRRTDAWEGVEAAWSNLQFTLSDLHTTLQNTHKLFEDLEGLNIINYDEVVAELEGLINTNREFLENINFVVAKPREEDVYWLTSSARNGVISLHQAPLHVGPLLSDLLYSKKRTIVMTSATMATDGKFDYIESRLGIENPERLLVGSPFDYKRSTLMLLAGDTPDPGAPGYQKTLENAVLEMVLAAEGRTMVLFTSHSAVQTTAKAIRKQLASNDILVLAHGDGPRHRLLQQFKANPRTVLLGTRSFWEGVDVVGDALSVLVIAKLPFEVPSDPVFTARSESFEDPFSEYAIPQAIIRLKQGFGRLIRSKNDRGVVVVMDKRLTTRNYGGAFIRSLPPCTMRKGPVRLFPREVTRWLDGADNHRPSSAAVRPASDFANT